MGVLDKIHANRESWYLEKGGDGGIEINYDCIKSYTLSGKVGELSEKFHFDSDVVLQIIRDYTKHLQVHKEKW